MAMFSTVCVSIPAMATKIYLHIIMYVAFPLIVHNVEMIPIMCLHVYSRAIDMSMGHVCTPIALLCS